MRLGRYISVLIIASLVACQTPPKTAKTKLPAILETHFSQCSPGEGAAYLRVYNGDFVAGSAPLEWNSSRNGGFQFDILDPIGRTALGFSSNNKTINTQGDLAARLPEIDIRDDGFLEIDSYFIAVKNHELPCLAVFKFPRGWLRHLKWVNTTNDSATVLLDDSSRTITIDIPQINKSSATPICATIEWSHFLGMFSSTIKWCVYKKDRRTTELSGYENYRMKWMEIDEG